MVKPPISGTHKKGKTNAHIGASMELKAEDSRTQRSAASRNKSIDKTVSTAKNTNTSKTGVSLKTKESGGASKTERGHGKNSRGYKKLSTNLMDASSSNPINVAISKKGESQVRTSMPLMGEKENL